MLRGIWVLTVALPLALTACSSSDEKKCEDFCGAGSTCVDGRCVAVEKTCDDFCGEGAACVGGSCAAVPACTPACGEGEACQDGACVATLASACGGSCTGDQICVTSGDAAACVSVCGAGQAWNSASSTCQATASYCGAGQTWDATALKCVINNPHAFYLDKPFANGPAVTAECIRCHEVEAQAMLETAHFKWSGTSTVSNQAVVGKKNLINNFCVAVPSNEARCVQCHPGYGAAPTRDADGNVTAGGAAYRDPKIGNIDCLICHANLPGSGYSKSPGGWGAAFLRNKGSCFPSCSAAQFCDSDNVCKVPTEEQKQTALRAAAMSVGKPSRTNCGFCHFNAGGGDNVKMGDLGTALGNPGPTVDVHMGSTSANAPKLCVDCHGGTSHQILGTGLSIPVLEEDRVSCQTSGCHGATPHADGSKYNEHAAFIACQTCHIPTFSRTQDTKTDWDWKTSGDKASCQGLSGCTSGETKKQLVGGKHQAYDWKKGVSTYAQGLQPVYFWWDGGGTHATTTSGGYGATEGESAADPIAVNMPSPGATYASGAKITPFKRMTGTQPAFADGSLFLVPHVFGVDGLWTTKANGSPTVPASFEGGWSDDAMAPIWKDVLNYGAGAAGQVGVAAKVSKNGLARASDVVTATTQAALAAGLAVGDKVYLGLLGNNGSFPGGLKTIASIAADRMSFTYDEGGADGALDQPVVFYKELPAWKFVYTEMFMNLNHEIAPKASALTCAACHPLLGGTVETSRMKALYNLGPSPACGDPMSCRKQ